METKILLRLIKDDILHLQGITDAFSMETLPGADEVELSLVRAKALLRQLELLHKALIQKDLQLVNKEETEQSKKAILEVDSSENKEVTSVSETISDQVTVSTAESVKPAISVVHDTLVPIQLEITEKKSVNDLYTQEKSELAYQIIPISSIWDGIGINDRYLFVRELFGNDSGLFEQTVTSLDHLATIQEAVSYLKLNFKWHKTEASQKFLSLVKRRFTI